MNVLNTLQVTFFMSQVQNSQTVITASGLFTVNKTILSSVSVIVAKHHNSFNGVYKILVKFILELYWCSK